MSSSAERRVRVPGRRVALTAWELVADDGSVAPVTVPGTVTQAFPDALDADERTWVFRSVVHEVPPGPVDLVVGGVATSYQVLLDGTPVASGRSMYTAHRVDVTSLVREGAVLEIRCLPLSTAMPEGKPPRSRWRTRLVADNDLRLIRTTLLGRCPGVAPGPPAVGPWRPVHLESAPVCDVRLDARLDGTTGVLTVTGAPDGAVVTCAGASGPAGELRIPDVARWWPHTHGAPVLHEVALTAGGTTVPLGRVGFRSLVNADPSSMHLVVNDLPVWVRGAVWTPPGLLSGRPEPPWETLRAARDAGMNMVRVPGLAPYESEEFFDACDELGILVWHDLALANLDVPHELLREQLTEELDALLERATGRPSLAVVCGGSETAQQVAMMGLDRDLWRSPFLDETAPAAVGDRAVWVANSPVGGDLPFRVGTGIAHWFGVGSYRRPLSDARTAGVRFASECLAFAIPSGDDSWVPRDVGSSDDFADVREDYATLLGRPSAAVVGEVMATVFGEWRRPASVNNGGLVLWLRDLRPGSGWGLLDVDGRPKQPWHHLRRALAPQAVWFVDEGLDGLDVHVANDGPFPLAGSLRLALYRDDGLRLEELTVPLAVEPHDALRVGVEDLLGRFVDASYAFRFGEPSFTAAVASLENGSDAPPQAFHFPAGRPKVLHATDTLTATREGPVLVLTAGELLDSVRVRCDTVPGDDAFCLEPGRPRRVPGVVGPVTVRALNLDGVLQL